EDMAPLGTYEFYKQSVENFCKPTDVHLWSDWKDESLISKETVEYADISKEKTGDTKYKEFLVKIKSDPSRIDMINLTNPAPNFLDKAGFVYKETMGTVYACAVLNAKVKIIKSLLDNVTIAKSNIKQGLEKQRNMITKQIDNKFCRNISEGTQELSIKKILLDNTTYQYCNYRQYLYYLDYASRNNLDLYFKSKNIPNGTTDSSLLKETDGTATYIKYQNEHIRREITHVKEIFPQAMVAYTEFERTYASHIILELILQDYIDLRATLKQLLNPIGQVIYKISNCQSTGK
ncbi:MAG: hypothetical protein Q8K26_02455, partial [Candidatus Gracilibacteria bacterium]|nr:hypothetical protein [Candidatus Gracilibacteria bacterium]